LKSSNDARRYVSTVCTCVNKCVRLTSPSSTAKHFTQLSRIKTYHSNRGVFECAGHGKGGSHSRRRWRALQTNSTLQLINIPTKTHFLQGRDAPAMAKAVRIPVGGGVHFKHTNVQALIDAAVGRAVIWVSSYANYVIRYQCS
jgi:hypothetical protein